MATTNTDAPDVSPLTQEDLDSFEHPEVMKQQYGKGQAIFDELFGEEDLQQSISVKPDVLQQISEVFPTPAFFDDEGHGSLDYVFSNADIPQQYMHTLEYPPFRFMDLPAELRDWIYDHLGYCSPDDKNCKTKEEKQRKVIGVTGGDVANGVRLSVREGPRSNLLLVSKRFNAEYTARTKVRATWIFNDTYQAIPLAVALKAATYPPQIKAAHFQLLSSCNFCQRSQPHGPIFALGECEIEREIGEHMAYVQSSLRDHFRHVTHYTIQLVLYDMPKKCAWPLNTGSSSLMSELYAMVTGAEICGDDRELSAVEIVLAKKKDSVRHLTQGLNDLKDHVTVARWTKKNGWKAEETPKKEEATGPAEDVLEDH